MLLGELMLIHLSVFPGEGEDSFAVSNDPGFVMLCVTDGCGGLGSKRYEQMENRTGAYLASRLAATAMMQWAEDTLVVPVTPEDGAEMLRQLEAELGETFCAFAEKYCAQETSGRIVGSMQRVLPTTMCTAVMERYGRAGCFLWAGDSRGYLLDCGGLHQYTADDVRGSTDALENLYLDRPLSNLISADRPPQLHMRRFSLPVQGVILCATDGVYNCISSPMELEMLLLDTLMRSSDEGRWHRRLEKALKDAAQDDATLLCCPFGYESFADMKEQLRERYEYLKQTYITPVRRRKRTVDAARNHWHEYRIHYDRTEGNDEHGDDWRV